MILGLGVDVVDTRRIARSLARFGARFEARVFSAGERALAQARGKRAGLEAMAATYAKRFAAKEACAKALGVGMRLGVAWRDMEIVRARGEAPMMRLAVGSPASARLAALTPAGQGARALVSLADDAPYALATVIIETMALANEES